MSGTNNETRIGNIEERIDWLMDAGFDFLATESGSSEFTHPSDLDMLLWMNVATAYLGNVTQIMLTETDVNVEI